MIANLRDDVQDRLVRGWEASTTGDGVFFVSAGAAVRDLRFPPRI